MFIRIEKGSAVPISRQVADQIETHCITGQLKPGQRLPSVRQLARDLAVNQNTILKIYERLTADGLLERRHGNGTFVAEKLPRSSLARKQRESLARLEHAVRHARALGVAPDRLTQTFEKARDAATGQSPSTASSESRS